MKDLSFQLDSNPCPQNDPNQGDLVAAIAAAADPPVAFRNFDHLVLAEPNTGSCLAWSMRYWYMWWRIQKKQIAAHAYPNGFIKD